MIQSLRASLLIMGLSGIVAQIILLRELLVPFPSVQGQTYIHELY